MPATKRFGVIPATNRTVTGQVLVQPETKRYIPSSTTMKAVTEQVLIARNQAPDFRCRHLQSGDRTSAGAA